MFILSAIVWLGLYLHAAMSNVVLRLDGLALPVGDQPAGAFVSAKFDAGAATTLTYGFDADGFAAAGSGWRVEPGDEWVTAIGFNPGGGLVVSNTGGDMKEYAWVSAVVIPEPGAAPAVAALPIALMVLKRKRAIR